VSASPPFNQKHNESHNIKVLQKKKKTWIKQGQMDEYEVFLRKDEVVFQKRFSFL
jgi:hypothetical protein